MDQTTSTTAENQPAQLALGELTASPKLDLEADDVAVERALAEQPATVSDLRRRLRVGERRIYRAIERLDRLGRVRVQRAPDGRAYRRQRYELAAPPVVEVTVARDGDGRGPRSELAAAVLAVAPELLEVLLEAEGRPLPAVRVLAAIRRVEGLRQLAARS